MRRVGGQNPRSRGGRHEQLRRAAGAAVEATERLVRIGRIERRLVGLTDGDRGSVQENSAVGFDYPATRQTKLTGGVDRHIAAKIDIPAVRNGTRVWEVEIAEVKVGKSTGGKPFHGEIARAGSTFTR